MRAKRLFVALDLPESITARLIDLNPNLPGVHWLQPKQMHLTLSFLGKVESEQEQSLREKLEEVRFTKFLLPIAGVGCFPGKGNPRIVWAGVGGGHPQLFHLYKCVQEAAIAARLEPDLRAWHPHITVARAKDISAETLRPFLKTNADFDAGFIRIETFSLYSSSPAPLGSAYTRELEVRVA